MYAFSWKFFLLEKKFNVNVSTLPCSKHKHLIMKSFICLCHSHANFEMPLNILSSLTFACDQLKSHVINVNVLVLCNVFEQLEQRK